MKKGQGYQYKIKRKQKRGKKIYTPFFFNSRCPAVNTFQCLVKVQCLIGKKSQQNKRLKICKFGFHKVDDLYLNENVMKSQNMNEDVDCLVGGNSG